MQDGGKRYNAAADQAAVYISRMSSITDAIVFNIKAVYFLSEYLNALILNRKLRQPQIGYMR